jgi:hypothetical protein
MESITPLAAFTAVPDLNIQLQRLANQLGGLVSNNDVGHFLTWQDFGDLNEQFFVIDRHHLSYVPRKNTRQTPAQHYALQLDAGGHLPFMTVLMRYPPVQQVLKDRLQAAYERAKETLREGPDNAFVRATHDLMSSHTLPPKVARVVLGRHQYNGPTPWHRLYDTTVHPEEHATLMVARQVTQQLHHTKACNAHVAMAVSLLSGVSPASFALAAIDRLQRTGTTFLTEDGILKMVDIISDLAEPKVAKQREQREDLIHQLEQSAADMAVVQDTMSPYLVEEVYVMLHQKSNLPAWGRMEVEEDDED